MNLFSLEKKTALITGGNSGIGAMIAEAFATAGALVCIVGRNAENNIKTYEKITQNGGSAKSYVADVTCAKDIEKTIKVICQEHGTIDILVNAAGHNPRLPAENITAEDWYHTIDLNLSAPYFVAQAVTPMMKNQGWGRIINLASLQSFRAFANGIPYGASKGGVVQLTRALAEAYSKFGILVNAIAPGFFKTGLTAPLFSNEKVVEELANKTMIGRNGVAEDLYGISVFLASDANSYITGQTISLDGGFSAK